MSRYHITEWEARYEVDEKGSTYKDGRSKRSGPLEYIRLRVHGRSLGIGWRKLLSVAGRREAPGVFGIFCKLLEIAGDAKRDDRGFVDDTLETPIHFLLDLDEKQVSAALIVLCKLGWIAQDRLGKEESTKEETTQLNTTQHSGELPEFSGTSGKSAIEDTKTVISPEESAFEEARVLFPGTKRGHDTEWDNLRKKHKDWKTAAFDLKPAIEIIIFDRQRKEKAKEFVPDWPMFQTWINQRRWEEAHAIVV